MKFKNHQHLGTLIFGGVLSIGLPIQNSHAEGGIVTDGTMGAAQSLTGTQVTIPQNLGTTVGQNLFHSFGQFNVQTGQTVTFTENTTNSLNNVISRVTGGSSSDINGLIRSTPGGHANFYLINPAGVVFGKDAQIDVPGAFHVSTANELKFADGNSFSATNLNGSSLSSVEPSSFGFLASTTGNNGLLQVQGAQLAVKDNQALDLVAGKIETSDNATLNSPGGEIRLVAMQGAGDVGLQTVDGVLPLPEATPSAGNAGAITSQDSFIKTNGDGGGRVGVWGGDVLFKTQDPAQLHGVDVFNTGAIDAAANKGIEMKTVNLTLDGARVRTEAKGNGNTGSIDLFSTQDIQLFKGGRIQSNSDANNNADTGEIKIATGRDLIVDGLKSPKDITSKISANNFLGNTGNLNLNIGRNASLINDGFVMVSNLGDNADGDTGDLTLHVGGNVLLGSGGSASTYSRSQGKTGLVSVSADGDITVGGDIAAFVVNGDRNVDSSAVNVAALGDVILTPGGIIASGTYAKRDAPTVNISAGRNILSEGEIVSLSESEGHSGNVFVHAVGNITLNGHGDGSSKIYSFVTPQGTGNAGAINVSADGALTLTNKSQIRTTNGSNLGQVGDVNINVNGDILVEERSTIGNIPTSTINDDPNSKGRSGNVNIVSGGNLTLKNLGGINAGTISDANGGNLTVDVKGGLYLLDSSIMNGSLSSQELASGNAGNINLHAQGDIQLTNSLIVSTSHGAGEGGNIEVTAGRNLLIENNGKGGIITLSGIHADSENSNGGDAGNINVKVQGNIELIGSKTTNSSAIRSLGRSGSAGNLSVNAQGDIKISDGGVIYNSTHGRGHAGNIVVSANNITLDHGNILSGSYDQKSSGQTGQVRVVANNSIQADNDSGIWNANQAILADAALAKTIVPGSIELTAKNIAVTNASNVYSVTEGNVKAGNIQFSSEQGITLADKGLVTSGSNGSGAAGNVSFSAPSIQLTNYGVASTRSTGIGDAGNINFTAQDINIIDKFSGVETITLGTGNAGNVNFNAKNINLTSGGSISTGAFGNGKGGNVSFLARDILVDNGFVWTNSDGSGPAGNVNFEAKTINLLNNSEVFTSAKGSGAAGNIDINSNDRGDIQVNKSTISSATFAAGKAGNVNFTGNNLAIIDGSIFSASGGENSSGETGHVKLAADKLITMERGTVSIQNESTTNKVTTRGSISVKAPDIHLTDSTITAETSGSSAAGDIQMTTLNQGDIQLKDSQISSTTTGSGAAGGVDIFANKLSMVGGKVLSASLGQNSSGQTGQIKLIGDKEIAMENGTVSIENASLGNKTATPGSISLAAPNINLKDSTITAESSGSIAAGKVDLTTNQQGDIRLTNSNITSKTTGSGAAGSVAISSNKLSMVDGSISSASLGASSTGQSGLIEVNASKAMDIDHGTVSIENQGTANQLTTPSKISFVAPDIHLKNSTVTAESSGTSAAGDIEMTTLNHGDITLTNTDISSTTSGSGAGGNVDLSANKLSMVGGKISSASLGRNSSGETGHVKLTGDKEISIENGTVSIENASLANKIATPESIRLAAPNINLKDSTITAESSGSSAAGKVDLTTNQQGDISLTNSNITSKTTGSGAAGSVLISTNKLSMVDGSISSASLGASSTGQSGLIEVNASKGTDIDRGTISIENQGTGNQLTTPSKISFVSPEVNLKDSKITAESSGTSAAGDIEMTTHNQGDINLTNTEISSTTSGLGVAGNVDLSASKLFMVGGSIASASLGQTSSGEAGHIKLTGGKDITMENGSISIENESTINQSAKPGSINLAAPDIRISNSKISTVSSGGTSAGNVEINFKHRLNLTKSSVQTAAQSSNGGKITIKGNELFSLRNSNLTTTVKAGKGNGGDIEVVGDIMLMDTAAIQANANSGHGGDIYLNVKGLLPSGDSLVVGGSKVEWHPFVPTFNVIQAASETGVNGVTNITAPQLNLSGAISNFGNPQFDTSVLSPDFCGLGAGSTLTRQGHGGLLPKGDDLLF